MSLPIMIGIPHPAVIGLPFCVVYTGGEDMAGETVELEVSENGNDPETYEITLDSNGNGLLCIEDDLWATWVSILVSDSSGSAPDLTVPIEGPAGPT